jgi:hypothetical protein
MRNEMGGDGGGEFNHRLNRFHKFEEKGLASSGEGIDPEQ